MTIAAKVAQVKRIRLDVLLCLCVLALAGCSPRYDWRDYTSKRGYSATFPGRVDEAVRDVDLKGMRVSLALAGANVNDTAFVVAVGILPDATATTRQHAVTAVLDGLAANVGADALGAAAAQLASARPGGAPLAGTALDVSGAVAGRAVHMVARVAARDDRLYQVMVVGPAAVMSGDEGREAIDTFLTSVRID